jgi:arylsulfatase A-like enzyme
VTGFPYYGQGKCPYDNQNSSIVPPPGWGCPVNRTQYPQCNGRSGRNDPGNITCFPDELTLGTALDFLRTGAALFNSTSPRPFWIGVGFVKPHYPQIYPSKFAALVPTVAEIALPPNPNFTTGAARMEWMGGEIWGGDIHSPAPTPIVQRTRQSYYASSAYSDAMLGVLLAEVDDLGLRMSTVVCVTADHGWGLGEHNHWSKYTNWETDVRVPMMVRVPWKRNAMGRRTSAIVEHVDLYPSIAELAGVPVDPLKESVDGSSWAGLLDDPTGKGYNKTAAYSQFPRCWPKNSTHSSADYGRMVRCFNVDKRNMSFMGYTVRTAEWRYTEYHRWDGQRLRPIWNGTTSESSADVATIPVELYDHRQDPPPDSKTSFEEFENANEAGAYPDVVQVLSAQLRGFFDRH